MSDKCASFSPSINDKSKILILGSMPGVKSLEMVQYYAHPQNRFWKVIGELIGVKDFIKLDYNSRLKIMLENNLALWDVIAFCNRKGSLDSAIKDEVPNDISGLLINYPNIKTICLNGNKSYFAFKKYFPEIIKNSKYKIYKMPSTSPANARFSLEALINEWKVLYSLPC